MMKYQYAIRTHVYSMCLADALKVLLKIMFSTETIISTTAYQGKNDVAEASVIILIWITATTFSIVGKS